MLIQTFAIRLLTVLVYFLPFTFFMANCSGLDIEMAYNKKDAIELEKREIIREMENVDHHLRLVDSSATAINNAHTYIQEELESKLQKAWLKEADWQDKLIWPAPYSLSGIGVLYYHKTKGMGVAMWMSVILSLVTFLFWRFIARWMIAVLFVGINFIVVLIYMISCLRQNVSLEYGFWLLFFLLLIQLWVEMRQLKYSIIGRLFSNINK